MKILYIDNRNYGHNADIHIDFFKYISKHHVIIPYGNHLHKHFKNAVVPNNNAVKELELLAFNTNPDCIITYNCNGSSYEVKLDNVNLYKWCEKFLKKTDIPKYHITTDYCRSGFNQEQADWFGKLGYRAAFFRHKESLKYPLNIPKYWLPFSVDEKLYKTNSIKIEDKQLKVGFIGAAHNSARDLYANRIAAINYLNAKNKLKITKITNPKNYERKLLFGEEYVKFLSENLFNLTCGGTCNYMTAKYFQIPAANSMLIGTKTNGLEIFPKDTYITYDKDNLDNMYNEILRHENDMLMTTQKITKLNQYVLQKHSHEKRMEELLDIIRSH